MVGPVLAGNLFSWSLSNGLPYPFDIHFVFYYLALVTVLFAWVSLVVPESINERIKEEKEEEDEEETPLLCEEDE
jgi:hypothetical protein